MYLGAIYHARNRGNATEEEGVFRRRLEADQTLRKQAEAKLASLTKKILDRDHVSRVYHDTLTRCLQ